MHLSPSEALSNFSIAECLSLITGTLPSQPSLSDVRSILVLSRLKLGAAMDELESREVGSEQLSDIACHAENIIAELEDIVETLIKPRGSCQP